MSRNMHRYEELTPYEFDQEKTRASIIYVGAGPLEYHEECNILGLDTNKGYDWCLAAAEITGGIVFPMLPVAPGGPRPYMSREDMRRAYLLPQSRDHYEESFGSLYPGVFFSRDVCRDLYRELLEIFADELKFKLCVFVGSHGPAGNMLKDIVNEEASGSYTNSEAGYSNAIGEFHGMRVMAIGSMDYNRDLIEEFNKENGIVKAFHGGLWETALNYAIKPEYFQPHLLDETQYPQHFGALREEYSDDPHRPSKAEFRKFSPEFAMQLRQATVDRLAADVKKNYADIIANGK